MISLVVTDAGLGQCCFVCWSTPSRLLGRRVPHSVDPVPRRRRRKPRSMCARTQLRIHACSYTPRVSASILELQAQHTSMCQHVIDYTKHRRIRIDDHGRVIAFMYAMDKEASFADCAIIVRDTGVVYQKSGPAGRSVMPNWCLLVQHMRRLLQFSGPFASEDMVDSCIMCDASKVVPRETGDIWGCPKCCTYLHNACYRHIVGPADIEHPYVCLACQLEAE